MTVFSGLRMVSAALLATMLGACNSAKDGNATGPVKNDFPVDESVATSLAAKGIPVDIARFFAATKYESTCPNDTTCIYTELFLNGSTRVMTLKLNPGRKYTPTPAETTAVTAGSLSLYGFTWASNPQADGNTKIDLTYYIPNASLPKTKSGPLPRITAASDGGEGSGMEWGEIAKTGADVSIGTILDASKVGPLINIYAIASAASSVSGALELSKQNGKWLAELDALEKCAANPTNQVSKSDPNYSPETVARIKAARSELKEVNAVRFLNQMTETGSGIIPATAVMSVGLKQGFIYNEKTLGDYSENTIMREARETVVPCTDPGNAEGNVDVVWECTNPWGSQVDHTLIHIVSKVNWVWSSFEKKYVAQGEYNYQSTLTVTGSGKTCVTTGVSGGAIAGSGRLMVIDDPAAQKIFGFGYTASGQIETTGAMSDDCGGTYHNPVPMTIDWLPNVTGFPGTGGAIEGERTNASCVGGNATGDEKVKFSFSVPPAE